MIIIKRNTFQKQIVYDTVCKMHNHPTAEEIYNEIIKTYSSVSKATVYRNLAELSESGKILQVKVSDGADCYDFNIVQHCHMRCRVCKKVFDVDIKVPESDFLLKNVNGFFIEECNVLFSGVCPDCLNNRT